MKKILLIAFAVLSLNSFAQAPKFRVNKTNNFETRTVAKSKLTERLNQLKGTATANKVKAKAPVAGATQTYYADYQESVTGMGMLQRVHVKYNIIFGNDGTISISNMFLRSLAGNDVYLTGKYDEATGEITIDNNQEILNINGMRLYVCKEDGESGIEDPDNEYKLVLDPEKGIVRSADENEYIALFITDGETTELYTDIKDMFYYPEDMFPDAVSHGYSYTDIYGEQQSTNIDIVTIQDMCYIRNLAPKYPDAWIPAVINNNNIYAYSYMIGDDDTALMFGTETEFVDYCTFYYNSSTDTYTGESGIELTDYFYYPAGDASVPEGYYLSCRYTDMTISGLASTGISKIDNSDSEAVSTEYFDLSGRRINNAAKGINIMVKKYADGTTKTVKVLK